MADADYDFHDVRGRKSKATILSLIKSSLEVTQSSILALTMKASTQSRLIQLRERLGLNLNGSMMGHIGTGQFVRLRPMQILDPR